MKIDQKCDYCSKIFLKEAGHINRSLKNGAPIYCNRTCAGLGRRSNIPIQEKKRLKAEYDKNYRATSQTLKQRKHNYFKRTYDKHQAAIQRKIRYPKHLKYLRTPEYKVWKQQYDLEYRAKKEFGEFWESALLINAIQKEYDDKEVRQQNDLHNKSQKRKKEWKQMTNSQQLI